MARRQHIALIFALAVAAILTITYLTSSGASADSFAGTRLAGGSGRAKDGGLGDLSPSVLTGGAIAPKLENATAKYVITTRTWLAQVPVAIF
jgi:hypothetical protein